MLTLFLAATLTLSDATNAALKQASALQQAEVDEALAAEELHQSWSALLPRARDAYTVTYNSPRDPSSPSFIAANAIHEYQNLLGVTGEFDLGMIAAVRRSRALLQAAHAGTAVARRALIRGVSEAYFGAALATAKRSSAETSLAAATEFERVTCLSFDAGEVPEVDCIRARLQTAARRDEELQAREAEAIANAQLAALLGVSATIEPLPQTIDAGDLANVTQANRPELARADAQLRAARAEAGAARGALFPRITYSLDRGFDSASLMPGEVHEHRGTLATANLDIPLFDWGLSYSKLKQAGIRVRGAELQRELTKRDLDLQFFTAKEEVTVSAARVDNARRGVADAEKNAAISVARYRAGEAPIIEATEAQTTLAQQRLALQQALFDFQVARVHLKEAAGE